MTAQFRVVMILPRALLILATSLAARTAHAAIGISGVTDKTKYNDTVSYTVTADGAAATTSATLDGVASVI